MKAIILAGGSGSRLGEITKIIPKPLVKVGDFPILVYIMKIYLNYGVNDFILALGYKGEKIIEYFTRDKLGKKTKKKLKSGFRIKKKLFNKTCYITFLDTGQKTMTGGRLKKAAKFLKHENFYLTYGDGLADLDIARLVEFHKNHGKMVTVTAVHPVARFGELKIDGDCVKSFKEKPQVTRGWINGGFFVCQPQFFDLIKDDQTVLEAEPLEQTASMGELMAYKHEGFWQCMDTKRDNDLLEKYWREGNAPWMQTIKS